MNSYEPTREELVNSLICHKNNEVLEDGVYVALRQEQERKKLDHQEEYLDEITWKNKKIKKLKRKNLKAKKRLKDAEEKYKACVLELQALTDKNKKLAWMLLQKHVEKGGNLQDSKSLEKISGSILPLIEADLSDYLPM